MIVQNFEILAMPTNPQSLAMTIIKSFISHKKQTIYNCTQHACKTSKFQKQELCIERKKERKKEGKVVERERERDKKFGRSEWVLNKLGQQEYQLQHLQQQQQQQQQTCLRSR
jgi:hypothetical protein